MPFHFLPKIDQSNYLLLPISVGQSGQSCCDFFETKAPTSRSGGSRHDRQSRWSRRCQSHLQRCSGSLRFAVASLVKEKKEGMKKHFITPFIEVEERISPDGDYTLQKISRGHVTPPSLWLVSRQNNNSVTEPDDRQFVSSFEHPLTMDFTIGEIRDLRCFYGVDTQLSWIWDQTCLNFQLKWAIQKPEGVKTRNWITNSVAYGFG